MEKVLKRSSLLLLLLLVSAWGGSPSAAVGCACLASQNPVTLTPGACEMNVYLACVDGICLNTPCAIRIIDCDTNGQCCGDQVNTPIFAVVDGATWLTVTCDQGIHTLGNLGCNTWFYAINFVATDLPCDPFGLGALDNQLVYFSCTDC